MKHVFQKVDFPEVIKSIFLNNSAQKDEFHLGEFLQEPWKRPGNNFTT